jgi:hypothetical protein
LAREHKLPRNANAIIARAAAISGLAAIRMMPAGFARLTDGRALFAGTEGSRMPFVIEQPGFVEKA